MIIGYDISNNNPDSVITDTADTADFYIAKVAQGTGFVDKKYPTFRAQALALNKGFGGYFFYDIDEQPNPEDACDFFLEHLGDQEIGEIAALDHEDYVIYDSQGNEIDRHNAQVDQLDYTVRFGQRFLSKRNYKLYLYITPGRIEEKNLNHPEIAELYNLWLAYWLDNPAQLTGPVSPAPFASYKLWQFNADDIDKDRFLETLEEFRATGKPKASDSFDYESQLWTPMVELINAMPSSHANQAFHANISNAVTLHKIARGVEQP